MRGCGSKRWRERPASWSGRFTRSPVNTSTFSLAGSHMGRTDPVVFITGGGRGLGADLSRAFHAAGYRVAIASRGDSGLARDLGDRASFIACDVRSRASVGEAIATAASWGGSLDVLVNNAGRSAWRKLADIDETFWDDMLATNLKSVLFAAQA